MGGSARGRSRRAVSAMLAILGAFGTGWALHAWAGAPEQTVVLAVVLALTMGRVRLTGLREIAGTAVEIAAVSVVAALTGRLLQSGRGWVVRCWPLV